MRLQHCFQDVKPANVCLQVSESVTVETGLRLFEILRPWFVELTCKNLAIGLA